MKRKMCIVTVLLAFGLLLMESGALAAAAPNIEWAKCFGGTGEFDFPNSILPTNDGGYIVLATTNSSDGDMSGNHGFSNMVIKLDSSGGIKWQKYIGGGSYVQQTDDGGYVIVGSAAADDRIPGFHAGGLVDMLVVKLNSSGEITWQKCLGGSDSDGGSSIRQTSDGGYILSGTTQSTDGDVSGYHGGGDDNDFWIVKLDALGAIEWQKCLGGTRNELPYSIRQTSDNGYIVAGWTESYDGDVSRTHRGTAAWVVKLDPSGGIVWKKSFGESSIDAFYSIQQTSDGGYIAAGSKDAKSGASGGLDGWIVKLDASGGMVGQTFLGGTGTDQTYTVHQTSDGGYIIDGATTSTNGDLSGNHGDFDIWVIRLNGSGKMVWQKCLGGTKYEASMYIGGNSIQQTSDGGYIVTGATKSNDGDVSGNHSEGGMDIWVVKLAADGSGDGGSSNGGENQGGALGGSGGGGGCSTGSFGLVALLALGAARLTKKR